MGLGFLNQSQKPIRDLILFLQHEVLNPSPDGNDIAKSFKIWLHSLEHTTANIFSKKLSPFLDHLMSKPTDSVVDFARVATIEVGRTTMATCRCSPHHSSLHILVHHE